MYRRRRDGDTFDPSSKNTVICDYNFKVEQLKKAAGSTRKTYTEDAVPSIFKFKYLTRLNEKAISKRPAPKERLALNYIASDSSDESESCAAINLTVELLSIEKATQTDLDQNHLENKLNDLRTEKLNLSKELDLYLFSFSSISKDEVHFRATTGLDVSKFMYLLELVEPGQNCEGIKFYEAKKSKQQETCIQNSDCFKRGPKPKLNPEDELFMTLVWLKNAFPLCHLSLLFQIPVSTVSRHLISWVNFLYFKLGSIPIWPSKEEILETMPTSFKNAYPNTRCIIDCTELLCQSPSSLNTQSCLYSSYKSHDTYKGLVGIAPSGAVIFVNQLYDGSISDKEIVNGSGFLKKKLCSDGDSVMGNSAFTIDDKLARIGVSLNIQAFLGGRDYLCKAEVKASQTIASVRIQVEREFRESKLTASFEMKYHWHFTGQSTKFGQLSVY